MRLLRSWKAYVLAVLVSAAAYDLTQRPMERSFSMSAIDRINEAYWICEDDCFDPLIQVNTRLEVIELDPAKDIFENLFGCTRFPCVIKVSWGGNAPLFTLAGKAATLHPSAYFIFEGPCASACTLFADLARARLCVKPSAWFGFHKGFWVKDEGDRAKPTGERSVPPYSADVIALVEQWGGFPDEGLLAIPPQLAYDLWPSCEKQAALPVPNR